MLLKDFVDVPNEPFHVRDTTSLLTIRLDINRGRFRFTRKVMKKLEAILNYPNLPLSVQIKKHSTQDFLFCLNTRNAGTYFLTKDKKGVGQITSTGFFNEIYTEKNIHGVVVVPLTYHLTEGIFTFFAPPNMFSLRKER